MRKTGILFALLLAFALGASLTYFLPVLSKLFESQPNRQHTAVEAIQDKHILETCSLRRIESLADEASDGKSISLIVGHAYGSPKRRDGKLAPALTGFLDQTPVRFDQIFFTGDVFAVPSLRRWSALQSYIGEYTDRFFIAPGNHDVGFGENARRDVFSQVFGYGFPLLFSHEENTFLVLDTTATPWTLGPEAERMLSSIEGRDKTLFILAHHIMRPKPTEIANSRGGLPDALPDHTSVLLETAKKFKQVYVVSGDTGAKAHLPRVECKAIANLSFVSQGLGDLDDEVLILSNNELVRLRLAAE